MPVLKLWCRMWSAPESGPIEKQLLLQLAPKRFAVPDLPDLDAAKSVASCRQPPNRTFPYVVATRQLCESCALRASASGLWLAPEGAARLVAGDSLARGDVRGTCCVRAI
jgi:hypothetical protein